MNNGIMFGTQGPLMSGYWVDPRTGDSFTVKDSFFEDGQYIITTMDGRKLSYDIIQNYVQSDKPIDIPKSQQKPPTRRLREVVSVCRHPRLSDKVTLCQLFRSDVHPC